jgi:glycosidase
MLAEASKPELLRSAFNIDYSWPLLHTFEAVMMRGEPASALRQTIDEQRAKFPKGALHMRVIDDHDELRAVTQFGFPGTIAAASVMMTLDGVPLIYNGMEVGDSTQSRAPALFEPQKIFWQAEDWHPEYPKFFTAMDALRHLHPALQQGELQWVHNSDEQHIVSFERAFEGDEVLLVANLSNTPFRGTVEVGSGNWKSVSIPLSPKVPIALPVVPLDAFQFRIFQRNY